MTSALIDTTNRLLGGSINDLSLYGGQVAVTIGAPETPSRLSDGLSVPDPTHAPTSRTAPADAPSPREDVLQASGEPQGEAPSNFHSTPFVPAPIQFGDPAHVGAFDVQVPAATGSGTSALPVVEAVHVPAMVPTAMPTSLAPPTLTVEMAEAPAPALAVHGSLTAPVLGLSDVDHAISSVVTTTQTLLDQTQQTVDALPPVLDIIGTDSFLGSDPVGGVATLVSMVDSTDAFDLAHAGVDIPEVAATGSILDTLADETAAGALLGDVAHGVDTLLPDHEHDGVLGL